ncbi:helix-turn-helix domain-containing protein [Variovorax sp. CY25R-8]|uniref:helix-turn-helix domain-containing protein n=1 Tax=Variovorax sp. CY25R-8 TaxID=2855501 RepID=UPI0021BB8204|nr:helix-turn-helix domain-containing protein [Variovorax sp. CY25R-8]MCT8176244.1 helix-turn-helix domain-containing protein [Variovorax sp. CY25R-8]
MTERVSEFGTSAVVPLEEADNSDKSAGTMLREAREAHGLHIEMVAAALKVSAQKLLALEADDIAALPDPVFARALASSVCRALRVDPAPVLAKLPGAPKAAVAMADRNLKTHIVSGTSRWGSGRSAGLPSRALLTVVALLLVGAAAIFWLPQSVFDRIGATVSRITARGAAEIGPNAGEPPAASGGTPGVATENVPVPAAAVGAVPPAVVPAPAAPVAAAPAATPPAAAASAAAASGQALVFVAREECWITVTDAAGKQLLRRSLLAGETVGLSGALPLSVVVGRASSVDVQVLGKPFDLKPFTRNGGVARFEVKS